MVGCVEAACDVPSAVGAVVPTVALTDAPSSGVAESAVAAESGVAICCGCEHAAVPAMTSAANAANNILFITLHHANLLRKKTIFVILPSKNREIPNNIIIQTARIRQVSAL